MKSNYSHLQFLLMLLHSDLILAGFHESYPLKIPLQTKNCSVVIDILLIKAVDGFAEENCTELILFRDRSVYVISGHNFRKIISRKNLLRSN